MGSAAAAAALDADASAPLEGDEDQAPTFRTPSGEPAALSCEEARRVVAQTRQTLAFAPPTVRAAALASGTIDWLDPHGLWSAVPGTPVAGAIERRAADLVRELERDSGDCHAAHEIGQVLARWVGELRTTFRAHRAAPTSLSLSIALGDPILEGASTRSAPAFAALLGDRIGVAQRTLGDAVSVYARTAEARFFPTLDAEQWSHTVLAAAVRAYVPLVDPHGAWAPLDEEASVYEVDLDAHPPAPLWDKISRTALGLRIESGAIPPFSNGDVVLSLSHVHTAGLPTEQIEQLALVADTRGTFEAVVVRSGETTPRVLAVDPTAAMADAVASREDLPAEHVTYADGDVLVVDIHEVRDDLGEQLTRAVQREHARSKPAYAIVLDLRGNGGGSTDGAVAALGLFLPGVPLFPMKRRDGSVETEHAPDVAPAERWTSKVATFVDGNTASAAEMIAGALAAYRRGPVVGRTTYGKGCAQEYADDDARAGVLRLTTLLYALPDGSAVQRVGLAPSLRVPFAPLPGEETTGESEAKLPDAPPTWRGPDVRDRSCIARLESEGSMQWPSHAGHVGPCKDPDVCRALRVLGTTGAAPAGGIAAHASGRSPSDRATSIARRSGP